MVHTFKLGEIRRVWPRPGLRVPMGPDAHNFLPEAGAEVVWTDWWHARAMDGSLCFTDPGVRYHVGVHAGDPSAVDEDGVNVVDKAVASASELEAKEQKQREKAKAEAEAKAKAETKQQPKKSAPQPPAPAPEKVG